MPSTKIVRTADLSYHVVLHLLIFWHLISSNVPYRVTHTQYGHLYTWVAAQLRRFSSWGMDQVKYFNKRGFLRTHCYSWASWKNISRIERCYSNDQLFENDYAFNIKILAYLQAVCRYILYLHRPVWTSQLNCACKNPQNLDRNDHSNLVIKIL